MLGWSSPPLIAGRASRHLIDSCVSGLSAINDKTLARSAKNSPSIRPSFRNGADLTQCRSGGAGQGRQAVTEGCLKVDQHSAALWLAAPHTIPPGHMRGLYARTVARYSDAFEARNDFLCHTWFTLPRRAVSKWTCVHGR
jgi:hypothetical protein